MECYDLIEKKKLGKELTTEEISYFIKGYTNNIIPDYQMSALLMAIFFQGLNEKETFDLTNEMIHSGELISLEDIKGTKVDKHSTGGVGDTTTLVLGPMVAALGVPFAKMSGRGLGHTGGTLDKLEAIPEFNVNLSIEEFICQTNKIGIAISGQTKNITPADKKIYALRDATATVDQISLIASSILSKKIAVGTDALILDVKVGSGAFMKTKDEARVLAKTLVELGHSFDRKVMAILTSMEEPLGYAIGNSLEVEEAIEVLKGKGPKDLRELCLTLGTKTLLLANIITEEKMARSALEEVLDNGKALNKFLELIQAQGGNFKSLEDFKKLPKSSIQVDVCAKQDGYIQACDALQIGEVARVLGAGRNKIDDRIDFGSGILLKKKIGDFISCGEVLATLFTEKSESLEDAKFQIEKAYKISENKCNPEKLILEEVD